MWPITFSGIYLTSPNGRWSCLTRASRSKCPEHHLDECSTSMNRLILIESSAIGTVDEDISAIDASELYRHAKEAIFFLLIVGGERILVKDDGWYVMFMTRPCELRKFGLDNRNEVGFSLRKFRSVHVWHDSSSPIGSHLFIRSDRSLWQSRPLTLKRYRCLNQYIRQVRRVKPYL